MGGWEQKLEPAILASILALKTTRAKTPAPNWDQSFEHSNMCSHRLKIIKTDATTMAWYCMGHALLRNLLTTRPAKRRGSGEAMGASGFGSTRGEGGGDGG